VFFIFLGVWYVFIRKFYGFCVFLVFILFWFKSLFWFSFWVKPWFLVLSMVESMFSGRPSRVKIRSFGKGLFGLLIFLWYGFWTKRLFDKHSLRLISNVLFLNKNGFLPNRSQINSRRFQKNLKTNLIKLFVGLLHLFSIIVFSIRTVYLHCKIRVWY